MELLEYLEIIKKYKRNILLLCAFAVITTFLLTYLMNDVYEASALILVKPHENITLADKSGGQDKELLNFPVGGGAVSKTEIVTNTYIEIIRSRAMAEKVVRRLGWDIETPEAPPKTYMEKVKAFLKERLGESVFTIKHLAKYGKVLARPSPLERAVENFQASISLEGLKDTYEFQISFAAADPQRAATAANVTAELFAQYMADLSQHAAKQPLEYLEQLVQESTRELAESRRTLRDYKEKNKTISFKEEITEEVKLIADLEKDLEKTEIRLAGYLKQFTSDNPKVQPLQAEKDRLLSALTQRKRNVDELPDKERQLTALTENVRIAEDINELILREYESSRIRSGNYLTEIELVSPAVAPLYPSRPIKTKYVASAFFIAFLVGIALAFVSEYVNATIRRVEDVEHILQLRVLATLPQIEVAYRPK